jgi:hypothetical protein
VEKTTNKELYALYCLLDILRVIKSRRMIWVGRVARMGREKAHTGFLVGRPAGKRPLGRHMRRLVDNIKILLRKVGWGYGLD